MFKKSNLSGSYDWIIVGLGNPGTQYENTRHNVGFMVCDTLAKTENFSIKKLKFKSLCGEVNIGGQKCLVMKPSTFMNKSGEAVVEALNFYKIQPERCLIIFDDISLPLGKLRVRKKGSAGGHNGMKNIIYLSGSDLFPRIKIGIGDKPHPDYDLANWVLSRFTKDEFPIIEETCKKANDVINLIIKNKLPEAMNLYN
ncbi:MAG: aminoacyl-tRNA hydrolase [Oscillospiraceae bacterium]|jgi:PTH1 family peptidyl-tRNA hydrolase|nr:aminoacyl-tRNA hydrolase [Oscillospiraceae bacterium]